MNKRQLTLRQSCLRQITALPRDRQGPLWTKLDQLLLDPFPDGKVRKKLKAQSSVACYRLRVGDYRLIYQFGENWLRLLAIMKRREDTYASIPDLEQDPGLPGDPDDLDDVMLEALLEREERPMPPLGLPEVAEALPAPLTAGILADLGVPESERAAILRCVTVEALLEAPVSHASLALVLDHLVPPTFRKLEQEPELVVPSTADLARYAEGELLGFLLRLDEEQVRLTRWALSGPTMVRGGAGTGKSTVALHRVKALLERPGATGNERVLMTTYTKALTAVTRQLLEQLLSPGQLARVRIATCDQVVHGIVSSVRRIGPIEDGKASLSRLAGLRARHRPGGGPFEAVLRQRALDRLSDHWLLEEIDWILEGRGLSSLEQYLEAPRPGRGLGLDARGRTAVWELARAFLDDGASERHPALRREALDLLLSGRAGERYDHVVVDEAQDLSPVSLALLAESCATAQGIFFAADGKQSIYSRNYGWKAAHPRLQFQGRTALLKRNYRSTRQIDEAAFRMLGSDEGEDAVASESLHEGPLPVLARDVPVGREAFLIARFIRGMARHLQLKASAAAVLVPGEEAGRAIAGELEVEGLAARYFPGRELDLRTDVVKVLTWHAAKGLEFPVVAVAGLGQAAWPVPEDFSDPGLFAERDRHERRLLYVALTRAMRGLLLVVPPGCRHPAWVGFEPTGWQVEEAQ